MLNFIGNRTAFFLTVRKNSGIILSSQNNHTKNPQISIHAIGEPVAIPKESAYFYIFYVIFVDFTRL
jgi:hypothetical protein